MAICCYIGKATKIFIFIVTLIIITALILGFGLFHRPLHRSNSSSCSQQPYSCFPHPTPTSGGSASPTLTFIPPPSSPDPIQNVPPAPPNLPDPDPNPTQPPPPSPDAPPNLPVPVQYQYPPPPGLNPPSMTPAPMHAQPRKFVTHF